MVAGRTDSLSGSGDCKSLEDLITCTRQRNKTLEELISCARQRKGCSTCAHIRERAMIEAEIRSGGDKMEMKRRNAQKRISWRENLTEVKILTPWECS